MGRDFAARLSITCFRSGHVILRRELSEPRRATCRLLLNEGGERHEHKDLVIPCNKYLGEVQSDGRVWSNINNKYTGEIQSGGRVWSSVSNKYVGEVQSSGRVWSNLGNKYIGEIQSDGRIWSTSSDKYFGETQPATS